MRILIVEDEPTLGLQLKTTLEQTSYAVDLSPDGEDGHFLARLTLITALAITVLRRQRRRREAGGNNAQGQAGGDE